MVTREEYEWYSEELRARLETERAAARSCDITDEEKQPVIWRAKELEAQAFLGITPLQRDQRNERHLHSPERSDLLQPDISELLGGAREDSWWQDRVICGGIQVGAEVEPVCNGPVIQPLSGTQNESLATGPLSAGSWTYAQHSVDGPLSNRRSLRSSDVSTVRGNLQVVYYTLAEPDDQHMSCKQLHTPARNFSNTHTHVK